jgi:predicted metalloprotease with PDZ domain
VGGVGTAKEIKRIAENAAGSDSLKLGFSTEGYGASDHTSFYGKDIPVLFISTGGHTDYHTPEDDVENLNLDGMIRIASYVDNILARVDHVGSSLTFQEAGPSVQYTGRRRQGITLGIMPDYTDTDDKDGMRADFVIPGRPAYIGGMKTGDYIMAIEGKPVNGIYDYMYRLSQVQAGQIIVVSVQREGRELDLLIQL